VKVKIPKIVQKIPIILRKNSMEVQAFGKKDEKEKDVMQKRLKRR